MKKLAVLALVAFPALAGAETITFEADSEILVVRGSVLGDQVLFDILGSQDGGVLCVAINAAGEPLATTIGFAQNGSVRFRGLKLEEIDRVACRYN